MIEREWEKQDLALLTDRRTYWQASWCCPDVRAFVLLVRESYFVSSDEWDEQDIGPFPTFDEARIVAETITDLNAWPFKKKEKA
jgi:hypothetical protein